MAKKTVADVGLEPSGNWIAGSIKRPGAFRARAQAAGKTTRAFAREKAGAPGVVGQEAREAGTLMSFHKK